MNAKNTYIYETEWVILVIRFSVHFKFYIIL